MYKELSKKELSLLFYLLCISQKNENLYEISKKRINISQMSKKLEISRQTYYSAIKVLKTNKYLEELNDYYVVNMPIDINVEQVRIIYKTDFKDKYLSCMVLTYLHSLKNDIEYDIFTRKKIIDALGLTHKRSDTYKDLAECL